MRRKPKWLALLLVLGLVLAACGDGGSGDTTTTAAAEEEPTTTAAPVEETTTSAAEEGAGEIATDVGVDLEARHHHGRAPVRSEWPVLPTGAGDQHRPRGLLGLVNEAGGINGLNVELAVRDTGYVVDTHVQLYEELKSQVVAFGHSTGSPHTVAINPALQADGILAIPLTWYSGWSDPAINANLVPHGAPYCIEAMNMIEYLTLQAPDATTIAIASSPGDYGEDSNAGRRDGRRGARSRDRLRRHRGDRRQRPCDPRGGRRDRRFRRRTGLGHDRPDLVLVVYGAALAAGFSGALWSGAGPSWNPAFVAPDSPIAEPWPTTSTLGVLRPVGRGLSGNQAVRDLVEAAGAPPLDYYAEGVIEAKIMEAALRAAYDAGDMTQAGSWPRRRAWSR